MQHCKSPSGLGIAALPFFATLIAFAEGAPPSANQPDNHAGKAVLKLSLPKPTFISIPHMPPRDTNADRATIGKHRGPFYVPPGLTNVALHKPVTTSDHDPALDNSGLITDGNKEMADGNWVTFAPGKQWVQIDLEQSYNLYAIVVWHYFDDLRVYRDVVVQIADDAEFIHHVHTVFNDDRRNDLGLGVGTDREYFETNDGKLIDAQGIKGRYVRLYSKGNTSNDQNNYLEVEVYGKTASPKPAPAKSGADHNGKVVLKLNPPKAPYN